MLIRSQDKERIINTECVGLITIAESCAKPIDDKHKFSVCFFSDDLKCHHYLAWYKDKKLAINCINHIYQCQLMGDTVCQLPLDMG